MQVEATAIPDVKLVRLIAHGDERGLFAEVWDKAKFADQGIREEWVLQGLSRQNRAGTIRALHFQTPPQAQAKLVRVARGRALDVAVDLRVGSPTYGRHVAVELSAEGWEALYIPVGFAHGFCALEDGTELNYLLSAPYSPECNHLGLLWNDPNLGIPWPVAESEAILAPRDRTFPRLKDLPEVFRYQGAGP
ncbi:dTDP-4-dehydrorhamnose 3,5-epimerase [Paramagnetospirillum caucaseum]|uniref:dTDP-4-dehydrorhamnose 3,5-epimerase n=1 Tax=Paramagnetospirillum caucaseum TaxID=1244869 RepID=M2Z426_9PROT|nr:dTDP-4-dehydrorhamnose 3,5-epimerase [Paramagnetospirillum caucaseum]EME69115.1 dTDP-4-dehydrorhamnose 3,5-epimerase [Paramagnetospirillum caucaseum]